jgi:uncharacterized protein (DUF1778 family)
MKSTLIKVRATPEEKADIEKAAAATGHTVSSFVRFASLSLAKKIQLPEKESVSAVKEG